LYTIRNELKISLRYSSMAFTELMTPAEEFQKKNGFELKEKQARYGRKMKRRSWEKGETLMGRRGEAASRKVGEWEIGWRTIGI
jgi:hypothetical protein